MARIFPGGDAVGAKSPVNVARRRIIKAAALLPKAGRGIINVCAGLGM